MALQPYIDLGWHTVPLTGKLERQADGTKTIPKFEQGWRDKYSQHFNTKDSKLGGVITGPASGIIAIDCDNELTWSLFRSLDPAYPFVFESKGKIGGTLIYNYTEEHHNSFKLSDDILALDFYSNNGFVYLPTPANKSKVSLSLPLPELKDIPSTVSALLSRVQAPTIEKTVQHVNSTTAPCIAPLLHRFTQAKGKFQHGLFRILTPRDFRDLPEYAAQGTLHPDDVPAGRGSEYMSKVSAILGADISVDQELYCEVMHYINSLFSDPMSKDRLDATVIDPMIEERAAIDGRPIWNYDETWEQTRLILSTKRQTTIDICMDDQRGSYYSVDEQNQRFSSFGRDSELISFINSTVMNPPKRPEITNKLSLVSTVSWPHKAFGFHEDADEPMTRAFNTFIQTPEMHIFTQPETYKEYYKEPKLTIQYFETLVPEKKMRDYLLQFLKRKLKTFNYSPVVLYFLGVHGSGKDTFVQILEKVLGHVARPSAKEFLEKHNGWITDSYFAQLDEYGNQLTRVAEKEDALGRLKAYTGKQDVQIRQMRSDGYMYKHNLTFIMTANKNPLMLEDGDRRVALFNTPNVLADQDWVLEHGGISEVYDRIMNEVKDFMYWLATSVPNLAPAQYMKPVESATKHDLIASSMYAAQRIAYCFKHHLVGHMIDLAEEFNHPTLAKQIEDGHVEDAALEELYHDMTEGKGEMRSLNKLMKVNGVDMRRTTKGGRNLVVYPI